MRRVITFRLDSVELARVDLIKIDVEGMEEEVLAGAEQTIRRTKPYLIVEHYKLGADPLKIHSDQAWLQGVGGRQESRLPARGRFERRAHRNRKPQGVTSARLGAAVYRGI
jgi:hypothetical protein